MEDYIELQEVDDFIADDRNNVVFPHVLIEGINTEEEVNYFHKKFCDKDKSLPLYIKFDTMYRCIGNFELTLDNLLVIRSISDYKIALIVAEDKVLPVDLNDPASLIKFITLK